jgi:hypothetical protein
MNWRESLFELSNLRIPRCYTPIHFQIVDQQLICFSDASEKAYCGTVYLRSTNTTGEGREVHISLVMAKTRVAPIKKVSLPRLELCGALLLAQMMRYMPSQTAQSFFTGSMALASDLKLLKLIELQRYKI